ncbi:uncharacterized protein LOC134228094 [Armigeres subalbatus]|uniref:uncharacterized protein LOC134228094 n=1 Tax=Armigeres subalbatus TaxID=124917 RepID=UPI002ED6611D
MKHTTVIAFLEKYGEVLSVTRERWKKFFPGVYNGQTEIIPPIVPTVSIPDQNQTNSSDDDDDDKGDENDSTSPHEADGNNKRRMSTRRTKERKKMCSSQGSQNDCATSGFLDKRKSKK